MRPAPSVKELPHELPVLGVRPLVLLGSSQISTRSPCFPPAFLRVFAVRSPLPVPPCNQPRTGECRAKYCSLRCTDIAQSRSDPRQILRIIRTTQTTPPMSRTRPAITHVAVVSSRGMSQTKRRKTITVANVRVQFFMLSSCPYSDRGRREKGLSCSWVTLKHSRNGVSRKILKKYSLTALLFSDSILSYENQPR